MWEDGGTFKTDSYTHVDGAKIAFYTPLARVVDTDKILSGSITYRL